MLRNARLAIGLALFGALGFTTVLAAGFDGTPSAPLPVSQSPSYSELDVQVHSRDSSSWQTLPAIQAQHGADCSGPPASHTNTSYEGSVYICKDHIMSAINGSAGYAEIVITPNLLFDFSHGGFKEERGNLGTVGLWCALHGEALLQAGMHHLECQFNFEALVDQLEAAHHGAGGEGIDDLPVLDFGLDPQMAFDARDGVDDNPVGHFRHPPFLDLRSLPRFPP